MAKEDGFESGVKGKGKPQAKAPEQSPAEKESERLMDKPVIIRTNAVGHYFGYYAGYKKIPGEAVPGGVSKPPRHIITLKRARRVWTEPGHTSIEMLCEHGYKKGTRANLTAEVDVLDLEHKNFGNPKLYRVLEVDSEKVAQTLVDAPVYEHPVDA